MHLIYIQLSYKNIKPHLSEETNLVTLEGRKSHVGLVLLPTGLIIIIQAHCKIIWIKAATLALNYFYTSSYSILRGLQRQFILHVSFSKLTITDCINEQGVWQGTDCLNHCMLHVFIFVTTLSPVPFFDVQSAREACYTNYNYFVIKLQNTM